MNSLYEKKRSVEKSINEFLESLSNIESEDNTVIDSLNKKNDELNNMNKKLIKEIEEKDKLINVQLNTINDYEKQINALSEIKEEENKFSMVQAKDKEICNLNKEIVSLKKELEQVNSKLELMGNDNSVSCEMNDIEETPVVDNVSENETEEVPEENSDEVPEENSDEDGVSYVSITHKKKEYYVEENNPNSKIFAILDDEDIGDIVGEMKNGKPTIYRKKKNN